MSLELGLLGEILSLSRDPDVNLTEFGELVARSPRLATEVVRIANSALYGMEGKINRLERAVTILGIRTVSEISVTLLVAEAMRGKDIGGVSGDALWMHSLETSVCAQLLARWLGMRVEAEAYLCGLIHDLGIVELFEEHGEAYADAIRCTLHEDVSLDGLEQTLFGETHGQRLARRAADWDFPQELRDAVEAHESPEAASDLGRPLALLLRAAHLVVDDPIAGWRDFSPSEADDDLLEELGLDERDIIDVREELQERMKDVTSIL